MKGRRLRFGVGVTALAMSVAASPAFWLVSAVERRTSGALESIRRRTIEWLLQGMGSPGVSVVTRSVQRDASAGSVPIEPGWRRLTAQAGAGRVAFVDLRFQAGATDLGYPLAGGIYAGLVPFSIVPILRRPLSQA